MPPFDELFEYTTNDSVVLPTSSYIGPGDVLTGALAWWGLRAYSAAKTGTKAVRIIRASDSAQQDFNTLSTGALDMTSLNTFLTSTTGKVVTLYDQTGNGFDFGQATDAIRPQLTLSIIGPSNIYPALPGDGVTSSLHLTTSATMTQAQPFTISFVSRRDDSIISSVFTDNTNVESGYASGSDLANMYAGAGISTGGAFNTVFRTIQQIYNGASSNDYVHGASNTTNPGTAGLGGALDLMAGGGVNPLNGYLVECGVWAGAFTVTGGGQAASMHLNQLNYWALIP